MDYCECGVFVKSDVMSADEKQAMQYFGVRDPIVLFCYRVTSLMGAWTFTKRLTHSRDVNTPTVLPVDHDKVLF